MRGIISSYNWPSLYKATRYFDAQYRFHGQNINDLERNFLKTAEMTASNPRHLPSGQEKEKKKAIERARDRFRNIIYNKNKPTKNNSESNLKMIEPKEWCMCVDSSREYHDINTISYLS